MKNKKIGFKTINLRFPKDLINDFDKYAQEKGYQSRKLAFIDMIKREIEN